jgi:hypothetical protein
MQRKTNSKIQAPTSKEIQSSNHQQVASIWSLVIGISLELGASA